MFDINTLAYKETTEMPVLHPVSGEQLFADKEETKPVVAHLYGPASKQHRQASVRLQNKSLKRDKKKVTAEELQEDFNQFLAECTDRIDNLGDGDVPITNFKALYADARFGWLREQVNEKLVQPDAFFRSEG